MSDVIKDILWKYDSELGWANFCISALPVNYSYAPDPKNASVAKRLIGIIKWSTKVKLSGINKM